jgi:GNAT superfamily N-acetyltransferase
MHLEIRAAAVAEAPIVSEILTEAAAWLRGRGAPLWSESEVAPPAIAPDVHSGFFFLGWSGPIAVGTMRLTPSDPVFWPEASPGDALYLHRLAVRRSVAGGQVSFALLRWALGHARSRGAAFLRLDCEASRPALRRIYERFGFSFHSERSIGSLIAARYEFRVVQ